MSVRIRSICALESMLIPSAKFGQYHRIFEILLSGLNRNKFLCKLFRRTDYMQVSCIFAKERKGAKNNE